MENNNIIKNRYYEIIKNNKIYAYMKVKKDFYCEGYLVEEKNLIVGYFTFYDTLKYFLFNNNQDDKLNSFNITPKKDKFSYSIHKNIDEEEYSLYENKMDEFFYIFEKKEIASNCQIKEIKDKDITKDIDYLIRNTIRNLNMRLKVGYDMLQGHRYNNLKNLIRDLKSVDKEQFGITMETIDDLTYYLMTLQPKEGNSKKQKKIKTLKKRNK